MSLANAPRDDVSDVRARPLEPAAPEAGRRGPAQNIATTTGARLTRITRYFWLYRIYSVAIPTTTTRQS